MRKLISLLIMLITVPVMAINVSAARAVLDDKAGLYSSDERENLQVKQQAIADMTGWDIAVVTTNTGFGVDGAKAMKYAEKYYDDTFGRDASAIVYLIDVDYRHFAMDGDVLNYFNTSRLSDMIDACNKKYYGYDDVGHLETFFEYVEKYYTTGTVAYDSNIGAKGSSFVPSKGIKKDFNLMAVLGGAITGIVVALISVCGVLHRYKFKKVPVATCYLNEDTVNIYHREDRFVREYTTRTRRSSDTDSSSSSGGSSFGGSSHGGGGSGGHR